MHGIIQPTQSIGWIPALLALLGVVVGAVLTNFLERKRNKEQELFRARREIYAKILVGMSSSFVPKGKINEFISDPNFITNIRLEIGELVSHGRLLAGPPLSKMLREFYDNEIKIWEAIDAREETGGLNAKRTLFVTGIEALMKVELGI